MKDWEKFGRDIWDAAINSNRNGATSVIVPLDLEDGGLSTVVVTPPVYTDRRSVVVDGELRTEWRDGHKLSNGIIKWGEWSL